MNGFIVAEILDVFIDKSLLNDSISSVLEAFFDDFVWNVFSAFINTIKRMVKRLATFLTFNDSIAKFFEI